MTTIKDKVVEYLKQTYEGNVVVGVGYGTVYKVDRNGGEIYFYILQNNPEENEGAWFSFSKSIAGGKLFGKKVYVIMLNASLNVGYINRKTDIEWICAEKGKKLVNEQAYKINAQYDLKEVLSLDELKVSIDKVLS